MRKKPTTLFSVLALTLSVGAGAAPDLDEGRQEVLEAGSRSEELEAGDMRRVQDAGSREEVLDAGESSTETSSDAREEVLEAGTRDELE